MRKVDHPLYKTWEGMMNRCYMESCSNYRYYGAKGVKVAERWHNFWNFVYDVDQHLKDGKLLYDSNYQLDKDMNGGHVYSLDTCVVITSELNREMNLKKKRKKVLAARNGKETIFDSIADTARSVNIPVQTVYRYLKNGKPHSSGYEFQYL